MPPPQRKRSPSPEQLPDLHPEDVFKHCVEAYQHKEYQPGHTLPAFPLTEE